MQFNSKFNPILDIQGAVLSQEEEARIDALVGESMEEAKMSDDLLYGNDDALEVADDGIELDEAMVQVGKSNTHALLLLLLLAS